MNLQIVNRSQKRIPRIFISAFCGELEKKIIRITGQHKHLKKLELTLVFVDLREGRQLNLKYRKKNYATDVLSFVSEDGESLGDLVICIPVIQRQALEHALGFRAELAYMLIHGVLHLLGYEHEQSPRAAQKMYKLQDQLFLEVCQKFKLS